MKNCLLFILITFSFSLCTFAEDPSDSLLNVLRKEIAKKEVYNAQLESRIAKLRKKFRYAQQHDLRQSYPLAKDLYALFKDYRFDSTARYARELIHLSMVLHDQQKLAENRVRLGTTLITAGMFKETFDCLRETDPQMLSGDAKKSYYILYSWAYSDLAKYNADKVYAPDDLHKKYLYLDSAISLSGQGTFERAILEVQRKRGLGPEPSRAFEALMKRKLSAHEEAMVATGLSGHRSGREKIRLLTLAAINDVRTSTYRALALLNLGTALYQQGELDEAYFFLQQALLQANDFGGRLQRDQVMRMLSAVSTQRERRAEVEKQRFLFYLGSVIGFGIISSLVGFIIFVQLKKVRTAEQQVRETNLQLAEKNRLLWEEGKIKEKYIGYFFSELSRYILKLDRLKGNVQRKVKSGSVDELLKMLNQVDITTERSEFFATFDRIFLSLFPDFVTALNSMFKAEDAIVPKTAGALTTQLRIFALMRLGINQNEMIAAILQYTVNTVYTYRFRAKTKALVPGDAFEQRIMGIQLSPE